MSDAPARARDASFPDGFLWGAATAAHQIEGSPLADGAGASIWTRFAHTPGMTLNGDTGDVACDHYRRWKQDVALMRELGLRAYRFSVSWSRIHPEGTGRVNQAGLDFYSRLVDELLENGIEPLVTLFHWDLPAALDDRGGWLNRDCADWFAEYGSTLYRALDGRVKKWATINEPWVVTDGGYLHGALAPGHRSRYEAPIAAHNLMRAHGAAVQAYRAEGAHEIGLVVNIEPKYPASDSAEDAAAVRRAHAYMNEQFLHPALLGHYPPELKDIFGDAWPDWPAHDFALIRQPLDFVGINYYTRSVTAAGDSYPQRTAVVRQPLGTYTETGWEVFPQGLTDLLLWFKDTYGDLPVYITENGAAFFDPPVAEDGRVRDPLRTGYLRKHLGAIHDAIAAGVDVRGYMAWSLLDNLEWSLGYSKRFGIVHVNYATQERTPKDSARWYSGVIASNGRTLSDPLPY
ncbi:GH1 family beta-glucosidase [Luteimonas sp. MC1750]|uniref:GH1 family beta-glucosidase n=1 Tax=Luteimonas sp. MC1750 TaxID=2799326 RepID=UPI0018F0A3C5|nr:GH1 family beta-glucosidase [Luteimonas sp. MC1750]MBJ6984543.1 beta-glucosidase [Luteimonas sp. MC1750]QQO04848.1 beta-glucosidase [Luteimonas sp. MC1750]